MASRIQDPSGMLVGHAAGTCMGFGAWLAKQSRFSNKKQLHRMAEELKAFKAKVQEYEAKDGGRRAEGRWRCSGL